MKKKYILTLGIAVLLVLGGCGAKQSSSDQSSSSSSSQQVTKVAYQNLSAKQRKQVSFRFQAKSDAGSDTLYNVTAKITNKTKRAITFKRSAFFIDQTASGKTIKADATGRVTVQPGKKITIKKLFIDVNVSVFKGAGTFYYLNTDYPLAYTYHAHQGSGTTATSLKDSAAKAAQSQAATTTSSSSSAATSNSSSKATSANANSTSGSSNSNATAGSSTVNSKNLTQSQLQAWAFKHASAGYTFAVTPNDFTFTFGTNSDGEATVTVAENHSSSNMQAQNADPNTNPTVASYTVNAQGELVNTYTQQVVASTYDAN